MRRDIRKQKPEVLDRGTVQHVVEINENQSVVRPVEDIGAVQIAVQPQKRGGVGKFRTGDVGDLVAEIDEFLKLAPSGKCGIRKAFDDASDHQFRFQRQAEFRFSACADGVEASDEPSCLFELCRRVECDVAPPFLRKHGKINSIEFPQSGTVCQFIGRHDGNPGVFAFPEIIMFIQQCIGGPPSGTVKFDDERFPAGRLQFINAVDVAVECGGVPLEFAGKRLLQCWKKPFRGQMFKHKVHDLLSELREVM